MGQEFGQGVAGDFSISPVIYRGHSLVAGWAGLGREGGGAVTKMASSAGMLFKDGLAQLGLLTEAPTGDLSGTGVSGYLNFLLSVQDSHREYLKRPGRK